MHSFLQTTVHFVVQKRAKFMGQYRYPGSRAKQTTTRAIVVIAVLFPVLFFACKRLRAPKQIIAAVPPTTSELRTVTSGSGRLLNAPASVGRLLPFSVIPGGVESAAELKNAIANDAVTARHYADFDAAKAQVVRLDRNRSVYVSYRLGNRIYWTSHRLTMLRGETIITDGDHEARTRCGNRISNTPQQPVSMKEPEQAVLENPPLPILPKDIPEWAFPIGDLVPALGSVDGPRQTVFVPSFIPPIIPVGGGSSSNKPTTPTTSVTPTGPDAPPVATPEPASLLLLSSGVVALCLRRKQRR